MKGPKRSERRFGPGQGHRWGESDLLGYRDARWSIFLPLYRHVLETHLEEPVERLRTLARDGDVVLLDYMTNGDVDDLRKPLSHAALVAYWVKDRWPSRTADEE